jgi:hypothetical protein
VTIVSAAATTSAGTTESQLLELLSERDAAIIELQQTVRRLNDRLASIEHSMGLTSDPLVEAPISADLSVSSSTGTLEVDEQAAQRALERTLIQGGVLLLPAARTEFTMGFGYTHGQRDFPVLVTDEDAIRAGVALLERDTIFANLDLRIGLPWDAQLELGVPYLWIDEETSVRTTVGEAPEPISQSGRGFGSVRLGLAKTLLRERSWWPDIVGRLAWDTGTGERDDGDVFLGGDFEALSGSLSFIKRADPLVFLGSFSYRTFLDGAGDGEPGDQYGVSLGAALAVNPTSSLSATFNHQYLQETEFGDARIDSSDLTFVSLNIGASTIVSRGILVNLSTNLGLTDDAPDYSIAFSTSIQSSALQR